MSQLAAEAIHWTDSQKSGKYESFKSKCVHMWQGLKIPEVFFQGGSKFKLWEMTWQVWKGHDGRNETKLFFFMKYVNWISTNHAYYDLFKVLEYL